MKPLTLIMLLLCAGCEDRTRVIQITHGQNSPAINCSNGSATQVTYADGKMAISCKGAK